jgi:hypothetical protein
MHFTERLQKACGKKAQDAIKDAIRQLEKDIKGHEKEIEQKWPGALGE